MDKTSLKRMQQESGAQALPAEFAQLEQLNLHAACIDVGSAEHWVCVPAASSENNVRVLWLLYPRPTSNSNLAEKLWGDNGGDGIDRSALDSSLSDSGVSRTRGQVGECTSSQNRSWTQERCARLSMAAEITHLWSVSRVVSTG